MLMNSQNEVKLETKINIKWIYTYCMRVLL